MDERDHTFAQKRKGSPSEREDEVQTKRSKIDEGDRNGSANGHAKETPSSPEVKREDYNAERETLREKHIDAPDRPQSRANDADSSGRPSSEPRRSSTSGQSRRGFSIEEEKKRGKRLFGGLLSTLSQTASTTNQQKRRLEIERKQQERAQHQRTEDDKRRSAQLAKLDRVRKIEQIKFDEQVMKTKHSNVLATARSLRTKAQPPIHYIPWELTKKQQDIIKKQVREAEKVIEKETQEFSHNKEHRLKKLGVSVVHPPPNPVGDPPPPPSANKVPSSKISHEKESDEREDEMVQDREDDVLY